MKRCPICDDRRDEDREKCFRCGSWLKEYHVPKPPKGADRFVTDLDHLAGETVEEAVETSDGLGLRLVGGKVAVLKAESIGVCCDDAEWTLRLITRQQWIDMWDQYELGLITQQQYHAWRDLRRKERQESERKEYERLKQKFETEATP